MIDPQKQVDIDNMYRKCWECHTHQIELGWEEDMLKKFESARVKTLKSKSNDITI